MNELPSNANICESGGTYYPVRLDWVPRAGDLIDLFSYIEQAAGKPPARHYEVVRVVHKLKDVSDNVALSRNGSHFVEIHVKPSNDSLFGG